MASADDVVVVRDVLPSEREAARKLTHSAYAQYAAIMAPSAWLLLQDAITSALSSDVGAEQIVAERGGRLLGSVLMYPASVDAYGAAGPRMPWPELRLLAVASEARGLGIGKRLVEECIRRAHKAGSVAIGLHTSRSMKEAIELYRRAGFMRDPAYDIHIAGAEPVDAYRLTL